MFIVIDTVAATVVVVVVVVDIGAFMAVVALLLLLLVIKVATSKLLDFITGLYFSDDGSKSVRDDRFDSLRFSDPNGDVLSHTGAGEEIGGFVTTRVVPFKLASEFKHFVSERRFTFDSNSFTINFTFDIHWFITFDSSK